ncbi:hypothetical protein EYF80_045809 [Liparis tanakae]|uniref:Uncharacterized protein n=1 Tax=Liparis tanakae TaxID=230148 RepID=A0A4Z2FSL9_9TELE|nr:hypothetical protein EYF80_045809 [Liparis tanakae]
MTLAGNLGRRTFDSLKFRKAGRIRRPRAALWAQHCNIGICELNIAHTQAHHLTLLLIHLSVSDLRVLDFWWAITIIIILIIPITIIIIILIIIIIFGTDLQPSARERRAAAAAGEAM